MDKLGDDKIIYSESDILEDLNDQFDPLFDLSYNLFLDVFSSQFQNALNIDERIKTPVTFRSKTFQTFIQKFNELHDNTLSARSNLVKELYILHYFAKAISRYNDDIIHDSYIKFRSHYYFPNVLYLLIRFLPEARRFFQKMLKAAYYIIKKNNSRLIYLFENAIYTDVGTIQTDVLYTFIGNAIKKINPCTIDNLESFFRSVFLNHFFYYFKYEQSIHSQVMDTMSYSETILDSKYISTRENLYRDVLTNIQVDAYQNESPTMRQIIYNYNIFKNAISNNEFQNIFLTRDAEVTYDICDLNNTKYKILTMYNKINESNRFIDELKSIPLIFKLLKSVHLITRSDTVSKFKSVNYELIKSAVVDELSYPFRNIIHSDLTILPVIKKIAHNFATSILSGEFINLQTLAPIKIDSMSFIMQLRKFIKLCLTTNNDSSFFSGIHISR